MFVPVNTPKLAGNEKKYLNECIDTGWISSEGPFVKKFEDLFAGQMDRKFGISVCNGTAALEALVKALDIGPGDEVILPSMSIISCSGSIHKAGATPVVVDCDEKLFNMTAELIEPVITEKTKAIMVVHTYGHPVDMDPIIELADKHKLLIIEDAAEMHGQTYKGKKCGSFGIASIFSFYPNKHVTTGEGGMILCDDEFLAMKCQGQRNLCFQAHQRFVHEELGSNFRFTNLQAAVGLAQLEQLEAFVVQKRKMGNRYLEAFKDLSMVSLPLKSTDYSENIYWVFPLVLSDSYPLKAIDVMKKLGERKIGCRPFFYPVHKQPCFVKEGMYEGISCPVSEKLYEQGFYIPSGLGMSDEEQEYVITNVREVLNENI